ncbi:hypothetical protein FOZ63_031007, partial [Perkinsus olseni]
TSTGCIGSPVFRDLYCRRFMAASLPPTVTAVRLSSATLSTSEAAARDRCQEGYCAPSVNVAIRRPLYIDLCEWLDEKVIVETACCVTVFWIGTRSFRNPTGAELSVIAN